VTALPSRPLTSRQGVTVPAALLPFIDAELREGTGDRAGHQACAAEGAHRSIVSTSVMARTFASSMTKGEVLRYAIAFALMRSRKIIRADERANICASRGTFWREATFQWARETQAVACSVGVHTSDAALEAAQRDTATGNPNPVGVIDGLEKDWANHLLGYHGVRSPPHIGRNPYVIHSIAGVAEIRSVALL
jgi:hypothetical protein